MNRRALAWLPACAYAGLIWFLSSLSVIAFPTDSFPLRDKGVHFFEFGGLAGLLAFGIAVSRPDLAFGRRVTFAASLASAFGALDEVHQAFTPGRSSDLLDWVADTSGAVVWAFLASLLFSYLLPRFWPSVVAPVAA